MKVKTIIIISLFIILLCSGYIFSNLLEDCEISISQLDENFNIIFIRENPKLKGVYEVTTSVYIPECACDIETTYNMVFLSGDIPKVPANLRFVGRVINNIYYVDMVQNVL